MIYEFAVYVNGPIKPLQVTHRSNKFTWGDFAWPELGLYHHPVAGSTEQPLTVTQLARVSRKIYKDLEDIPVFYRINQFYFYNHLELNKFLVAITPSRRCMIHRISMGSYVYPHHCFGSNMKKKDSHFLTMLLECTDLREFVLKRSYHLISGEPRARIYLQNLLNVAQEPLDAWSLWNLPSFKLEVLFDTIFLDIGGPSVATPVTPTYSFLNDDPIAPMISQLKSLQESRKQRLKESGHSLKTMVTSNSFQDAVTAANIDFPGENRVTLDMINSSVGAISSRTRRRCLPANHDAYTGRVKYMEDGKYDGEGLVKVEFSAIKDMRWNDSTIECEVEWDDNDTEPSTPNSWEKLDTLLTASGAYRLEEFYSIHLWKYEESIEASAGDASAGDASAKLEALYSIPSPKNITDVSDALLYSSWIPDQPSKWTNYSYAWKTMKDRYAKVEKTLEEQVNAERQESASQSQKKASSRKQKKSSRSKKN